MVIRNWLDAEAEFEAWFSGTKLSFAYRFEDARAVMGALKSQKVIVQGRPSDFLVTDSGVTFFAEVKSSENPTSFPLSNIKKPQWNACRRTVAAKGLYFFYIRKEPELVWFKVPGAFFLSLQDDDIKSVKWEHFESYRYVHGHNR